jgi:hypothetical protein
VHRFASLRAVSLLAKQGFPFASMLILSLYTERRKPVTVAWIVVRTETTLTESVWSPHLPVPNSGCLPRAFWCPGYGRACTPLSCPGSSDVGSIEAVPCPVQSSLQANDWLVTAAGCSACRFSLLSVESLRVSICAPWRSHDARDSGCNRERTRKSMTQVPVVEADSAREPSESDGRL